MNDFVLVLDRLTGKLLFAQDFTYLGGGRIDLERPVLTAQADWYCSSWAQARNLREKD
jgi:hypothetical protein